MADIKIDAGAAQSAMDAIGKALFAAEKDPAVKGKLAELHAALAAGEALVIRSAGAGQMKPQDGGDNKPPPNQ